MDQLKLRLSKINSSFDKRKYLMDLLEKDRNIFYELLSQNIQEYLPIIYIPLISRAVIEFEGNTEYKISINDDIKEKLKKLII